MPGAPPLCPTMCLPTTRDISVSDGMITLANIDDVALRVIFPAMLAMVLALAPGPSVRLGRIAKDLTVISLIASMFAGDLVPLMVASYPLVLAASAIFSRSFMAQRFWPEACNGG